MGILVNIFAAVIRVMNFIMSPFINFPKKQRIIVQPITDDLLKISATKLAALIRKRELSSESVVRSYIKRINEVNPLINAVVEERFEKALKEAKSIDGYLKTSALTEDELLESKPLLGVPFTVKASCQLSEMDFCVGVELRRGMKADKDGYAVAKMKSSGAIPLLVSNTPEGCMSWYCSNKVTGTTCNPYDVTRSSGGSSGGEGALVGAGASVIGMGSDLAGSVRIPAMWCGVFGHKPTPRIISLEGHFPYPSGEHMLDYFTIGPITRYAEDLKLLLGIMASPGTRDLRLQEKVDFSKLRVYYLKEVRKSISSLEVEIEIKKSIDVAVKYLQKSCKCTLMKDNSSFEKSFSNSFLNSAFLLFRLGATSNSFEIRNVVMELLKAIFRQSKFTFCYLFMVIMQVFSNLFYQDKFSDINEELKRKLSEELRDDGVLICPTFSCVAPKHSEVFFKYLGLTYLAPFNTMGFAATQVPCGKGFDGLPIGLQVVAAPYQDRLCFAVAEELEKCFGGWLPPNSS